jgi:hypothetical protein
MALRIGLLESSALQNDGHDVPVILQCRTPQETNPKGNWGPILLLNSAPLNGDVDILNLGSLVCGIIMGLTQPHATSEFEGTT